MPFLFALYIIAYIDRINIGFAGLQMTAELHFSDAVFGFGSGVFFVGYGLLGIPGAVLIEKWSARKAIALTMLVWGFVASATGLIHSAPEFYAMRFILGVTEAGFFPGVIGYLSHWYRGQDRGKAIAMFMAAIPVSQVIAAPLSAALMKINWLGLAGWRWLLILEGAPAVIAAVVSYVYLADRPRDAQWLATDEREWLAGELEREQIRKTTGKSNIDELRPRDSVNQAFVGSHATIGETLLSFRGRTRRKTFWAVIALVLVLNVGARALTVVGGKSSLVVLMGLALAVLSAWILLANCAKRWHDMNRSGWVTLTLLIPIIGIVALVILGARPGTEGTNEFGWDPRGRRGHTYESQNSSQILLWAALEALLRRDVLLLALAYFGGTCGTYGLSLWMPKMIQRLGHLSIVKSSMLCAIPALVGIPAMLLNGWHSDHTGERRWHASIPRLVAAAALASLAVATVNVPVALILLALGSAGIVAGYPPLWAIPSSFLGSAAAAASIGLINSFGNLGGFAGPYLIGLASSLTGAFSGGMWFIAAGSFASALLVLLVRRRPEA